MQAKNSVYQGRYEDTIDESMTTTFMKDLALHYCLCHVPHFMITGALLSGISRLSTCMPEVIHFEAYALRTRQHHQVSRQQHCDNDRKLFTSASRGSSQPLLYPIDAG